jgi:nucleotidyltransferase/DNA polymerase involved in DNA repair
MTTRAALTPAGALGWLESLSIDVRAAAVLDADGAVLAGDPALAGAAEGGDVIAARSEAHAIVVRTGPRPLRRLLQADLRTALESLEIA